jgi:hypothetical protein
MAAFWCLLLTATCVAGCSTPVGSWRFNDAEVPGRDHGADSLDGKVLGAARIAEVDGRSVLELDGTDGLMELIYDVVFDLAAFRIEAVFKLAPEGLGKPNSIIGKGASDPARPNVNYALAVAPDGAVAFGFDRGPGALVAGPAVLRSMPGLIEPEVWYRVTAGFDGRDQFLSVALDERKDLPLFQDRRAEPAGPRTNNLFPLVGAWRGEDGLTRFFHGWIDEISVEELRPQVPQ